MTSSNPARGLKTRLANKTKRRDRILACAAEIIAEQGLSAFTIAELAKRAEVTIPTVHNLLGKRADILDTLVDETMEKVMEAGTRFDPSDPAKAVVQFIDGLISLFSTNENLYRAAFLAGEWTEYFEHQSSTGIVAQSQDQARRICQAALEQGKLEGRIDLKQLTNRFFASQRLARLDWMNGYINLAAYRTRVLTGMYITLCADASPQFKDELIEKIEALSGR